MTKEGEEQEKKKLRREKTRVGERRKLIEMRKNSSDRLFMLERDLSLVRSLIESRICTQELLSAKVKRQIGSNGYLYLPLKVTVQVFPPIKVRNSPPLDYHRTVERGEHRAPPEFNEDMLHIPRC